jgi:hypothetical protein
LGRAVLKAYLANKRIPREAKPVVLREIENHLIGSSDFDAGIYVGHFERRIIVASSKKQRKIELINSRCGRN